LYWFHNHGGRFIREHPNQRSMAYQDRNPAWICGGIETNSPKGKIIKWTQPEILLYDDDPYIRMSYPDLVQEDGNIFITETQKDIARVHHLDNELLETLWNPFELNEVTQKGLVLSESKEVPKILGMPKMPPFVVQSSERKDHGSKDLRAGFSIDIWFKLESLEPGQILLDNRTPYGKGFALQTTAKGSIELVLSDGRTESRWDCDPGKHAAPLRRHGGWWSQDHHICRRWSLV
jgi:hypothetical protein